MAAGSVFLLVGSLLTGVWFSPQIDARVCTPAGEPVAGAIVVANWNIHGPLNGASQGQLALAEVISDDNGRFRIPAWGPRTSTKGGIRIDEPTIRIFKPGFVPLVLKNYEGVPMEAAASIIVSRFQNATITLTPFNGPPASYEASLKPLLRSLDPIFDPGWSEFCYWKQTPRLLFALETLKTQLAEQGGGHSLRFAYQYGKITEISQCGNSQQFFQDYSDAQMH